MVFLFLTDVIFSIISTILYNLPILALFAKITPARIEGTIFAFLTGTMNLANSVISPNVGVFINHQFVGVNKRDLSKYWILVLIGLIGSILTFALLPLIPTRTQLREWKEVEEAKYKEEAAVRRERRNKRYEDEAKELMGKGEMQDEEIKEEGDD